MEMKFRDRDAPVSLNGLIFRTFGYDHPRDSCFCDLEYAPETLYTSGETKALRDGLPTKHYKFYFDGGLKFALNQDPPFKLHHGSLSRDMVGIRESKVSRVVRPDERLAELMKGDGDSLQMTCVEIIDLITDASSLKSSDFGVFGSLAHGFHNPQFSDVDLIIYGVEEPLSRNYTRGILSGTSSTAGLPSIPRPTGTSNTSPRRTTAGIRDANESTPCMMRSS